MTISVTFKNMESSEHLKQYAVKRFEKLSRFCSHFEPVDIQITMLLDNKVRHKAEVHVVGKGLNISALEESADMYASIDMVLDKVEAQIKKLAEKQKDRRRTAAETRMVRMEVLSYPPEGELVGPKVVSSDIFSADPLEVDEAATKLEQAKHDFWVFLNAETNRVNVIYKRSNGDFGLIDPDV